MSPDLPPLRDDLRLVNPLSEARAARLARTASARPASAAAAAPSGWPTYRLLAT